MKRIKVNLLNVTPVEVILNAISKPYKTEQPTINTIRKVCFEEDGIRERHGSVLEHVTFNFEILGSSRCELQEHMRHRIASPTVESTRFALNKIVNEYRDVDFWNPKNYHLVEELFVFPDISQLDENQQDWVRYYYMDMKVRCIQNIRSLKKEKIPNDIAKYLIVEGWRTNFTWSINWRSFVNFINLRTDKSAHFEIRHIANLCLDEVNKTWIGKVFPKTL